MSERVGPASEQSVGLRERKRRQTARAIEIAAIELASVSSVDQVTVEEISHAADVSPRTFFNYFPTKEAAMFGLPITMAPIEGSKDSDREYADAVALAEAIVQRFVEVSITRDREIFVKRKHLLARHPDLVNKRMATMREYESALAERLRPVIARDLGVDATAPVIEERARMLVLLSLASIRSAFTVWMRSDDSAELEVLIHGAFESLRDTAVYIAKTTERQRAGE